MFSVTDMVRHCRWHSRRWSAKRSLRRALLPIRRYKASVRRQRICRPFAKSNTASSTNGPAAVFGDFTGTYGLARAAAYDLQIVRSRHRLVEAFDIGPYLRGKPAADLRLGSKFENLYFLCQPDVYGTVFALLDPSDVAQTYRIGRWAWETPIFPKNWAFAKHLLHEVWAPSAYCASTFRSGTGLPVQVFRHAVSPPPNAGIDMSSRLGVPGHAFMGLAVMDIQSCPARKNPWAHIHAWKIAFGEQPDAVLVLKLRVNNRTAVVLDELRDMTAGTDNVILLSSELDDAEMASLHHSADVFVSLHRAEGFGLGIYEALLLRKPVVATDWSANAEFGPEFSTYHPVQYKLIPYRDWMGHYPQHDFMWADPDVADAARLIRRVYDNRTAQPAGARPVQLAFSTANNGSPAYPTRMHQTLAKKGAN